MKERIIIGLVGHPSCGKDTVADYLASHHNFVHVSTSNLIREYIKENNLGEPTREKMLMVGNDLRRKNGPGILSVMSLAKKANRLAVSGIRVIGEAETIKSAGGKIVCVTTPLESRYARAQARGRVGENITLEEFKQAEEKELVNPDIHAQNVNAVIAMADYVIENTGTLEDLYKKVDEVLPQVYN